jgi:hypothetical protein
MIGDNDPLELLQVELLIPTFTTENPCGEISDVFVVKLHNPASVTDTIKLPEPRLLNV